MLHAVDVGRQSVARYASSAGEAAIARLRERAAPLRNARILHLNATPYGGGVAEILRSEVALLRDLGLDVEWRIITGDESFFRVTKTIHNALQGDPRGLTAADKDTYLGQSARNASLFEGEYDIVVVHDPQPLALRDLHGAAGARWVWRCHIDTSEPNEDVWGFLRPHLGGYDAAIYTMPAFVPPDGSIPRIEVIPPAIDPESPKNFPLDTELAQRVLGGLGIDLALPLIVQVSRFDPWKDPLGVIAAYRIVRDAVPDLQLALVGSMALDDPEGWEIYRQIQQEVDDDPQIHVATNLTGVGNIEVNAFQRLADVVVQKSIREGFGLVVSETLWKETPVVAGRAGGIPLQMADGDGGFLVDTIEECAERVLWLLRHPEDAQESGQARARPGPRALPASPPALRRAGAVPVAPLRSRERGRVNRRLADDEHVARRVMHDGRADRAEQRPTDRPPTVRPDHDQVGSRLPGLFDDRLGRISSALDDRGREPALAQQRPRLGEGSPAVLCLDGIDDRGRGALALGKGAHRTDDAQRPSGPTDLGSPFQRPFRAVGAVVSHDDRPHRSPPLVSSPRRRVHPRPPVAMRRRAVP